MQRLFQVLSCGFIAVAFFFVWRQDFDAVFVAGVIGACCFFLAMRYEIQERRDRRDAERQAIEADEHISQP